MSRLGPRRSNAWRAHQLSSLVIRMISVWRTSNMLCENADNGAPAIELIRRNTFNRFAEAQKLSLALGRQRATLACKLVHCGAAYLTRDCFVLTQHRKFKDHPVHVVTQDPAPHERHLDHPRICKLEKCVVFWSLSRGARIRLRLTGRRRQHAITKSYFGGCKPGDAIH